MTEQTYTVEGMTCGHCVAAVTKAVKELDPAAQVKVDLASGKVEVDSAQAAREAIARAIEDEGYTVAHD